MEANTRAGLVADAGAAVGAGPGWGAGGGTGGGAALASPLTSPHAPASPQAPVVISGRDSSASKAGFPGAGGGPVEALAAATSHQSPASPQEAPLDCPAPLVAATTAAATSSQRVAWPETPVPGEARVGSKPPATTLAQLLLPADLDTGAAAVALPPPGTEGPSSVASSAEIVVSWILLQSQLCGTTRELGFRGARQLGWSFRGQRQTRDKQPPHTFSRQIHSWGC